MRKVVIMSGISGSGKSVYANKLVATTETEEKFRDGGTHDKCVIVSADHYFIDKVDGVYKFNHKLLAQSHATCFRSFIDALQANKRLVIVDNTNISAEEIAPYMLGGSAYGYESEVITMRIEPIHAQMRNVHNVPSHTIFNQYNRLCKRWLPKYWIEKDIVWSDV